MDTTYSLRVIRAQDIRWKPGILHSKNPNLFVKVKCANETKRTRPIQSLSPTWDETVTITAPATSTPITLEVKHRRSLKFRSSLLLGSCHISITELMKQNSDGEARLDLYNSPGKASQKLVGAIYIYIDSGTPEKVIRLEIKPTPKIDNGDTIGNSTRQDIASQAILEMNNCVEEKSTLYHRTNELMSRLEALFKLLGPVSELNPYTKIACSLCTALCQESSTSLASNQFKTDKLLEELIDTVIAAFDFVKDASALRDKGLNYAATIDKLLQQTIEFCRFVKQYLNNGLFKRMVEADNNQKINDFTRRFIDLRNALDSNIALHTAFVSARVSDKVDVLEMRQRLSTLKDALDPFKMDASNNPLCLPGTRRDILNQIMDWLLSDTNQNMLWLHGVAGSGKSTINATIAEYCRDMSCLGAFLFFKRGQRQDESIIPTIAYRLASFDPAIAKHVAAAVERNNGISEASVESQFNKLILQPLTAASSEVQTPIIIILDALDEYGTPGTRRRLLHVLRHEIPKLPTNFRFLITSRREPDIEKAFSPELDGSDAIRAMELDYTSDVSRRDVCSYLEHEMRRVLEDDEYIVAGDSLKNIILRLSDAAAGLFIWASTIVKLVSDHDSPFRKLNELASNTNTLTGINQLYASILRSSTISWDDAISKERFSRIIGLVLLSNAPLMANTIDGLLGLTSGGCHSTLSRLRSVVDYKPGEPIRLFHTSFSDYLLSAGAGDDWFIDVSAQHAHIATRCFTVMEDKLHFNICDLKSSYVRNDDVDGLEDAIKARIPPHLSYACNFWARHLHEVPFKPTLLQSLSAFLYTSFLFWLEVLSLQKNLHFARPALLGAKSWISHDMEISRFLKDAQKMVDMFYFPISQSAPHIYLSMLPLAGEDSYVSAHYLRWTSSLVSVKQKGVKHRSALLKLLEGHTEAVTAVTVSHDGTLVASASNDGTIRVWDEKSGECIAGPFETFKSSFKIMSSSFTPARNLELHKYGTSSITFSPDDKRLIVAGPGSIKVVDIESRARIASHYGEFKQNKISPVAISQDGKLCARVSALFSEAFEIWDVESGVTIAGPFIGHTDEISTIAFTRDGRYIASGSADNSIRVWEVKTGLLAYGPLLGHTDIVNSVAFSPDGKRIVSGSCDKTIRIWDLESGEVPISPIFAPDFVDHVTFSPDGTSIVSGTNKSACVWNAKSGSLVSGPFLGHTNHIRSITFYSDGTRIVSGSDDRTIRIWDAKIGNISSGPELVKRISSIKFSTDNSCIISNDGTTWNIYRGEIVEKSNVGSRTQSLAISDSMWFKFNLKTTVYGSALGLGYNYEENILVWDAYNGSVKSHGGSSSDCPTHIAVSPNGRIYAFGSENGTIRVWDQGADKLVCGPFEANGEHVHSLVFSPDGTLIASAIDDHVTVWHAETGELVYGPFQGHRDQVMSIDYSPDGCYIASGSLDHTIRVWDVATGVSEVFEGHTFGVASVSYSADGSLIVSSSRNDEIRIWSAKRGISTAKHIASAKAKLRNNCIDASTSMWTSSKDGWIRGSHDELLLWIPPDIRLTLITPLNIAILNCEFMTTLDFADSGHGEDWQICFNSLLSESKARRIPGHLIQS